MMLRNVQKAALTIIRTRDHRSFYNRDRGSDVILELKDSLLNRHRLTNPQTVEQARLPTEFGEASMPLPGCDTRQCPTHH